MGGSHVYVTACRTESVRSESSWESLFLYISGNFTPIDFPRSSGTEAFWINKSGQRVGAFLDTGGVFTAIDVPGAISNDCRIGNQDFGSVGTFNGTAGHLSFVEDNGAFTIIAFPVPQLLCRRIRLSGPAQSVKYYASHVSSLMSIWGVYCGTTIVSPATTGIFWERFLPLITES